MNKALSLIALALFASGARRADACNADSDCRAGKICIAGECELEVGSTGTKGKGKGKKAAEAKGHIKLGATLNLEGNVLKYSGKPIDFEYDSDKLRLDDSELGMHNRKVLQDLSRLLKKHKSLELAIEGHSDSRGEKTANGQKRNIELSAARAKAVRKWLIDSGVEGERLYATGVGYRPDSDGEKEPEECYGRTGSDGLFKKEDKCVEAWDVSRHTRFRVVEGLSSLRPKPEPEPSRDDEEPAEVPKPGKKKCGTRVGLFGALGAHSQVPYISGLATAGMMLQPVCAFDVSLGLGAKYYPGDVTGTYDLDYGSGIIRTVTAHAANAHAFLLPLNFHVWLLPARFDHSVLLVAGPSLAFYSWSTDDQVSQPGGGPVLYGHIGVGYGFRSQGPDRFIVTISQVGYVAGSTGTFKALTSSGPQVEATLAHMW